MLSKEEKFNNGSFRTSSAMNHVAMHILPKNHRFEEAL